MSHADVDRLIDQSGMLLLENDISPAAHGYSADWPWLSRFSDGHDVMIWIDPETREMQCVSCLRVPGPDADTPGTYVPDKLSDMLGHLTKHVEDGHQLPVGLRDLVRERWSS